MERFLCIHGHFYQPPRENPWLEAVEIQDSAAPYHDWNQRITAECYAPNSAARILDGDQRILNIISNYARISFNFGPTLLSWMEKASPDVYQAILDADRQSIELRSGHGAAIAQVYNHLIMPLANTADKRTQIIWGIRDFEHRFQRFPEGMWLAETAVDLETFEIMAELGISYTILEPHQATAFRKIGDENWTETDRENGIDPTRAYVCRLGSQRSISIFFYNGPISRTVAFEKLLASGETFAERLITGFTEGNDEPQLLNIATDGETYGHHQKFGDMALAYALNHIESNHLARLTNYGEFLELHPADHEVQIHEQTSWSCSHGVERWKGNCGCNSGGNTQWNQEWRAPLRSALDWLRDRLAAEFSKKGKKYLKDPWQAREAYIGVILQQDMEKSEMFLARHCSRELDTQEKIITMKLLEMQRQAMLMFTSCGWFFDELSGIEAVQVIQYACRAVQLAEGIAEQGLEKAFVERLKQARSNITEYGDGATIYKRFVLPTRVDLTKVGAHYAFSSLFEDYEERTSIFCYAVASEEKTRLASEDASLALGRIHVASEITEESDKFSFCVVRFGSHDFKGGVSSSYEKTSYDRMREELTSAFDKGLYTEIIDLIDRYFDTHNYSLASLFRDEQRKILNLIIDKNLEEFNETYERMYEHSRPLMEFVHDTGMPLPRTVLIVAQPALHAAVKKVFVREEIDTEAVQRLVEHIRKWQVKIDSSETEFFMRKTIEELMHQLTIQPDDLRLMIRIQKLLELARDIQTEMILWQIQNNYYKLAQTAYREQQLKARDGDQTAATWLDTFNSIGLMLAFNMGAIVPAD
ncbi:MAG TPA: DUF3536 domain-containing protein [Desulfuromonadaceae bacterium]